MALPIFKAEQDIPEAFRAEYEAREDGSWHPKAPPAGKTDADVAALDTTLQKERQRAKDEEKARRAAEKERDDLKRAADARAQGISEEALARIRQDEEAARKPILDENAALKAENDKLRRLDLAQRLFLLAGGMEERVEDAMLHLDKLSVLGDSGGLVWKDWDGKVTADDDAAFFAKFRVRKPFLFKGTNASGSGAQGNQGDGTTTAPAPNAAQLDTKRAAVHTTF